MIPLSGLSSTALTQQITFCRRRQMRQRRRPFFHSRLKSRANRNVRITANAPVNNSWADLDVDLVNEQNNEVESVEIPIEYYSGSDTTAKAGRKAASRRCDTFLACRPENIRFVSKERGKTGNSRCPLRSKSSKMSRAA